MERLWQRVGLLVLLAVLFTEIALSSVSANEVKERPNVGGRSVAKNEGNWQVAISHQNRLVCSGSLLRNNVVITSAACVSDLELSELKVRGGSKTFKKGGQVRKVIESIYHPQYQKEEHSFNIALLKLKNGFNFTTNTFETVTLPKPKELELPSSLFIYGWGISSLNANGTLSTKLRVSKFRVHSQRNCLDLLSENDLKNEANTFCVGDRTKQADICNDDVGGPAVSQNRVQYGVISYGGKCLPENAIILTNIVPQLPWIRGVLRQWKRSHGSNGAR